jgi:predicted metalloprotease with PDZ domain
MIDYRVSYEHAHRHFISFEATWEIGSGEIILQLPSWRPGRYELGNFAKNITNLAIYDEHGKLFETEKKTKDSWKINSNRIQRIKLQYEYYAADLNAGSSFLDSTQLYINPVNCFFYESGRDHLPYRIEFVLPEKYEIACGLKKESPRVLLADSFDQLADSPLIASDSLQHFSYRTEDVNFHIWVQGKICFDINRLLSSFELFTKEHFKIYGDIPCSEYHFLFQFPEIAVRHGVEHQNSTVIAMGPSSGLSEEDRFLELIGISCHELFHTWNVKNIRPKEMFPYDFTRENYSPSGLVYEGVTTYYGDLLLWRTGVFSDDQFFSILSETIETHLRNDGRFHLSLALSSLETWLDGYVQGNPWRKVNIYNEGCLLALICDVRIMAHTSFEKSLDNVVALMYERFGKKGLGYSLEDYKAILEEVSGISFDDIFTDLVWGTSDYVPYLKKTFELIDISMSELSHDNPFTSASGAKLLEQPSGTWVVSDVMENSPADRAGLWRGDIIRMVDERSPQEYKRSDAKRLKVHFSSQGVERSCEVVIDESEWCNRVKLSSKNSTKAFQFWKNRLTD